MRQVLLNKTNIDDFCKPYVIAELGNNHQGSIAECKKLILAAKESGADAVKLQKRSNKDLFTQSMLDSPYDNPNSYGKTYGKHREYLELDIEAYFELKECCETLEIDFFATPFDIESVDTLDRIDLPFYKVASGDLTNIPLIECLATRGKPIIISTGGATLPDIDRAHSAIRDQECDVVILQCTAAYPARSEQLNLQVIQTLREKYPDTVIGYSGHDNGIAMPLVAYVLGARVIEKHFTLDRTLKGTDHVFSLTPNGLKSMVRDLRRAHSAMGDGAKRMLEVENGPITKMSKQLVASRAIQMGEVLKREDISIKSPGGGLFPYQMRELIGRKVKKSLDKDDAFSLDALSD
jgi:sialic acid synthase